MLNAPGLPLQNCQTNPHEGFLCFSDFTSYNGVTSFQMGGGGQHSTLNLSISVALLYTYM